jgi:4-hydroxyphenylpyruvate dioxygenase
MSDFCPIKRFDHLEYYVGNARQAAQYYAKCFGFAITGYRGLETGVRDSASYLLEQGEIRFVLTSALTPEHPAARSVAAHGDGVAVIALEVPDVAQALAETTRRGAREAQAVVESQDAAGFLRSAEVHIYGDTRIRFVERSGYAGHFAPGFEPVGDGEAGGGVGLAAIDHIVGNVPLGEMQAWADFFARTMGFSQLVDFSEDQISTEYSALMSKVMMDGTGKIKFPINEPAQGRKKGKSQIQEYLDYYGGPGVQHVACLTGDIIDTVSRLRESGVGFLGVPKSYYDALERRVGEIAEPVAKLAELGILVDRDSEGYLLQIFTQPVEDRPTLFYEIIQRKGARGFGEGNFKALFESIEREQALRGNL